MEWSFLPIRKSDVERDVSTRGQFDTDDARIEATLIREAHQNSLDARAPNTTGLVKTRISLVKPVGNVSFYEKLFAKLQPHLEACEVDISDVNFSRPEFLLVEDFGTTGLTGKWDDWDENAFCDFWRREGRSHKSGTSGGRHGLGKLVLSLSSRIRSFFGLTVRYNDTATPLLMGEAVLSNHVIAGKRYVPYGFFANTGDEDFQLPSHKIAEVEKYAEAFGVKRKGEPGLSLIIPFPIQQLSKETLIEGVLKNYFFPILTKQLEVEVQGEQIDADTFEDVAQKYASDALRPELIQFIRKLDAARKQAPIIRLAKGWENNMEVAIGGSLEGARMSLATEGKLIHARAPITLRRKDGGVQDTHFDLFLMKAPQGVQAESLYIRSAITIPNEARYFSVGDTYGALLASEGPIASFLGDAENPAHTLWNGSAEKLKMRWKSGSARLSEIRSSLKALHKALSHAEEQMDETALIDFFSVEDLDALRQASRKHQVKPGPPPDLQPSKRSYRIASRKGGFAIKPAGQLPPSELPFTVQVQVAYDLVNGNPIKRYNPLDFKLDQAPITITASGAKVHNAALNLMELEITDANFSVEVNGFDAKRDILVHARKES